MKTHPPRLARLLLRIAVPARDREYVVRDLDEEFDNLTRQGTSPRAARRWYWEQVRGSIVPSLRRPRKVHAGAQVETLMLELRSALRNLRRYPLFTLATGGTLALGLGATTAMFAIVNGVLLKPLPYEEADRLVSVWHRAPGMGFETLNQTTATYLTYRDENRVFDGIGLWDNNRVSLTGIGDPEQIDVILATHTILDVLGVTPILGRSFAPSDDSPDAPWTTVLTHGFWQRRFGGDPDVIGRTITLSGAEAEIIGVLGPNFRFLSFLNSDPAIFLPFRIDPTSISGVYAFSYQAIARLHEGMTVDHANADVERMIPMVFDKFPGGRGISREEAVTMGFGANVRPLKEEVVGDIGPVLLVLLVTVGFFLVVASGNVANLFLVRAERRQREMAIRTALGAGRGSLRRQALWETMTISLLGGALGLGLAAACIRILHVVGVDRLPRLEEIAIDGVVISVALAIAVVIGVMFGLHSARPVMWREIIQVLRETGKVGSLRLQRTRLRNLLVVTQLALGLVLLVGSGLILRSFMTLQSVQPGFERPEELLTFRIAIPSSAAPDVATAAQTHEAILNRIRAIPGVSAAGMSSSVSMDGWDDNNAIYIEEQPLPQDVVPTTRQVKWVSALYVETMENTLLAGRTITWSDIHNRAAVTMVTENFAREFWDDPQSALGQRISDSWQGPWYEIVGVVGNVYDDGVDRRPTPIVYWPLVRRNRSGELDTERSMGYAIRSTRIREPGFFDTVRQAVWAVNPNLPLASVRSLDDILARSMGRTWFLVVILGIAAGASALLAIVGVYGVASFTVAHRTSEIGVRMALGATRVDVTAMVIRHGMMLSALGIAIGLLGASTLTPLMRSVLIGVEPIDPLTFGASAVALGLVTLAASYFPARRAARLEPMDVLRWE